MKTENKTIKEIILNIDRGIWVRPKFQRQYIWHRKKYLITDLVESIIKGDPIGQFLLLEYNKEKEQFKYRQIDYNKKNKESEPASYAVDGLQRLTTIYRVFNDYLSQYCCIDYSDLNNIGIVLIPKTYEKSIYKNKKLIFLSQFNPINPINVFSYVNNNHSDESDGLKDEISSLLGCIQQSIIEYQIQIAELDINVESSRVLEIFKRRSMNHSPLTRINLFNATIESITNLDMDDYLEILNYEHKTDYSKFSNIFIKNMIYEYCGFTYSNGKLNKDIVIRDTDFSNFSKDFYLFIEGVLYIAKCLDDKTIRPIYKSSFSLILWLHNKTRFDKKNYQLIKDICYIMSYFKKYNFFKTRTYEILKKYLNNNSKENFKEYAIRELNQIYHKGQKNE